MFGEALALRPVFAPSCRQGAESRPSAPTGLAYQSVPQVVRRLGASPQARHQRAGGWARAGRAASSVAATGRLRLGAKGCGGEAAWQPGEFGGTLGKLLDDGEGFLEQSVGRKVFQIGRLITGDRGERRKHAAEFVGRFA